MTQPVSAAERARQLVDESCNHLADLLHYGAAEIRAGKLTAAQVDQFEVGKNLAKVYCDDPAATAASSVDTDAFRAALPAIAAAISKR